MMLTHACSVVLFELRACVLESIHVGVYAPYSAYSQGLYLTKADFSAAIRCSTNTVCVKFFINAQRQGKTLKAMHILSKT